ncbi:hypothetical protein [Salinisphaera orenii]|uniref:hypothetical protein n=1 Tax=Salinisphaera orenii TaxID=856731 RepID=UPI000F4C7B70|nr:hypothetical protein [Salinisphaera orenii]
MTLSRRELLKHGLALGSLAPFAVGLAAGEPTAPLMARRVAVYGPERASRALRQGFSRAGWQSTFAGRLNVLELARSRPGYWIAGFADDAELVLLTSLAAGRGRIVALGRHAPQAHSVRSWKTNSPVSFQESNPRDWRRDLGGLYAALADHTPLSPHADTRPGQRVVAAPRDAREHSFLIRV